MNMSSSIIIGTINLEWQFARGVYNCLCVNYEDIDIFDKVICGLLYHSNSMTKSEIGTLMGLNIIDDPSSNKYLDISEKAILDNAIKSLQNYDLITLDGINLQLTEKGRNAVETRKKYKGFQKTIELTVDEFSDNSKSNSLLEIMNKTAISTIENPEWNVLQTKEYEILKLQKKDLTNLSKGTDVLSMNCVSMDYYLANLLCSVCYDLLANKFFVCSNNKSKDIDSIITNNLKIQTSLLNKFFANQIESVFNHQYQVETEKLLQSQLKKDSDFSQELLSIDALLTINDLKLFKKEVGICFYSVHMLSEELKRFILRQESKIVCVEYEVGSNEDDSFKEKNCCFRKVNRLRTNDFCISNGHYYSIIPLFLNFNDREYSLPMLLKYSDDQYNHTALYAPFNEFIMESVETICVNLETTLDAEKVNNFRQFCINISTITSDEEQKQVILNKSEFINRKWKTVISDSLIELETDIKQNHSKESWYTRLQKIERDIKNSQTDEELLSKFKEIRNLLHSAIKPPINIQPQNIYILDTSVLMNHPKIWRFFDLSNDKVVVPRAMQQELDGLAHDKNLDRKESAVTALKQMMYFTNNHPQFYIQDDINTDLLPIGFDPNKKDNHMLASAIEFDNRSLVKYNRIIIVSDDVGFVSSVNDYFENKESRIQAINSDELLLKFDKQE